MKEEFRVQPHTYLPDKQMVECWRDGKFVAGIYSDKDGIRVVSKYFDGSYVESAAVPPVVIIKLKVE
ncbi:MAG: hypothetical protein A2Y59_00575 [Chloroflexi bacterium RBG_13_52_14]|nr:MAG: hypothetical protein A2Y59_00575 [Chloroflexi bacterium RBG_13_52_14]